jgi:cytochrome c oxidase subunit 2
VKAVPKEEFEKWLADQQAQANKPATPAAASTAAAPATAQATDAPVSQGHQG